MLAVAGWAQAASVMKPGAWQKAMKDHSPCPCPPTHIGTYGEHTSWLLLAQISHFD